MFRLIGNIFIGLSQMLVKSRIGCKQKESETVLIDKLSTYHQYHNAYSENDFSLLDSSEELDLSIIIPFYNAPEKYINDCLNSLIAQKTKYKYDVICINDGSTNNTLEILKDYEKNHNCIKVYTQKNQGISASRNQGILLSKAKYVGFLDQDDWVDVSYIDCLLHNAFSYDADVVKCSYSTIKDGQKIDSHHLENNVIYGYIGENLFNYTGMIWSGIYKKTLFKDVRFPESFWYEDMITRFLVYRKSNVFVSVKNEMYFKRKHASNASVVVWNSKNNKCLEHIYLVYQLCNYCQKLSLPNDNIQLKIMLDELGTLMWWRLRGINKSAKQSAFLLASNCINNSIIDDSKLNSSERVLLNIYKNRNYSAWVLFSVGSLIINR